MNRKELIQFLHEYPSIVAVTDHPKHDNLTVEFADGTVTKFNPNMLGGPDDIDILLIKRILHAMDIAIANQELPGKVLLPEAQPLVRSADYFLECGPTTPVAVAWLTDFIGMGLGALRDDTLRIIDETQLPENHDEFDDLQLRSRALENLHAASEYLAVAEFGLGPNIVGVTRPMDNESAWFADAQEMEMAMRQLSEDTNSMWVAIPAHASRFLLVNGMASPAEWHAVLDLLEETMQFDDSIYPVPHIIVDGQWEERPPPPDTDWGQRFRRLQLYARQHIYHFLDPRLFEDDTISEIGQYSIYAINDELFSLTVVPEHVPCTSVPLTDLIFFDRGDTDAGALVRREELAENFPHLIQPHEEVHPPRFRVFQPTPAEFAQLPRWE